MNGTSRLTWGSWLARSSAALGLAASLLLSATASADVRVSEHAQGWITSLGGNNRPGPDSNNYTGNENGMRYNSWAAFYIPPGQYTSATLSLTPSTYGDVGPSTIGLFQVEASYDVLLDDYVKPGIGAFNDLGSGRQYASTMLFNSPVTLDLNRRAVADINAAGGTFFLIGFTNQTLNALPVNGPEGGVYISGFGRNQTLMTLDLGQTLPVPEPATWAAMLSGLAMLATRIGKLRRRAALLAGAAAVCGTIGTAPSALADTINFEGLDNVGFVMDGGQFTHAGYVFSGQFVGAPEEGGGLVGAVLDGADGSLCLDGGLTCPGNNASHYYGGLNDGVLHMTSSSSGASIRLTEFDASFIGGQQAAFPDVSGLLMVRGWRADGSNFDELYSLANPVFGFAHYQTSSAFRANDFVQLSFISYACNFDAECFAFESNMGQFGLDNLAVSAVPEPSIYLMMGLGLGMLTLAGARRRQA